MPRLGTTPWDPADYLDSPESISRYLAAAFEDGEPALITAALGDIARARGMAALAAEAGLGRESLYKALSAEGNPKLSTVLQVLNTLGLQLRAVPIKRS